MLLFACSPLFVTWTKAGSWGKPSQLRGCIGTLEPRKLHTALKDYALTR
jgi:AMMECR1 domain-containing protein